MSSPSITTYTRKSVNPLNPELIDIADIAHSLACVNRFAGHAMRPLSVAQHSVYVSRVAYRLYLENNPGTPAAMRQNGLHVARQGLLHDASEAYLGDVTKWLKMTPEFAAYRTAEERVQHSIYVRFKLLSVQSYYVTQADEIMVRFEGNKAYGPDFRFANPNYPPVTKAERALIGSWQYWTWQTAKEVFLAEARTLGLTR